MVKKFSDWMNHISSDWVALVSLVVFILFVALVLPTQASKGKSKDAGTPDLSFYYSADDLYQMAESYGEEGRAEYVKARFTFDVIWPLVYTTFLCVVISWVSRRSFQESSLWQRMNLSPVAAAVLDFLENISTSIVMARYPVETPIIDSVASLFTMAKWVLVSFSFLFLLASAIVAVWRRSGNQE
jgi:hypothetical protein